MGHVHDLGWLKVGIQVLNKMKSTVSLQCLKCTLALLKLSHACIVHTVVVKFLYVFFSRTQEYTRFLQFPAISTKNCRCVSQKRQKFDAQFGQSKYDVHCFRMDSVQATSLSYLTLSLFHSCRHTHTLPLLFFLSFTHKHTGIFQSHIFEQTIVHAAWLKFLKFVLCVAYTIEQSSHVHVFAVLTSIHVSFLLSANIVIAWDVFRMCRSKRGLHYDCVIKVTKTRVSRYC